MKITVAGIGYVGLSMAVALSIKNKVTLVDIDKNKVNKINNKLSPIKDDLITKYLSRSDVKIEATLNYHEAYKNCDIVIIAVPTNYDKKQSKFDTTAVEEIIKFVTKNNPSAMILIKSTLPMGFTEYIIKKTRNKNIFYCPEFLREGSAMYDTLYPSRIIIGTNFCDDYSLNKANILTNLIKEYVLKENVKTLIVNYGEAEAIKLFSNTYLAMRISFFNELDTFAEINNLNTKAIIGGICLDERIGDFYNNPSFGYGGYCLPKDTKQLASDFKNIPQKLISAVVKSNQIRKGYIAKKIIKTMETNNKDKKGKIVGIYNLSMKKDSENFRNSAVIDIIRKLKNQSKKIVIYEPNIKQKKFLGCEIINDLNRFKSVSDLIIANRYANELNDVKNKIYTRDIFNTN